jgi:hypothetical protein
MEVQERISKLKKELEHLKIEYSENSVSVLEDSYSKETLSTVEYCLDVLRDIPSLKKRETERLKKDVKCRISMFENQNAGFYMKGDCIYVDTYKQDHIDTNVGILSSLLNLLEDMYPSNSVLNF